MIILTSKNGYTKIASMEQIKMSKKEMYAVESEIEVAFARLIGPLAIMNEQGFKLKKIWIL